MVKKKNKKVTRFLNVFCVVLGTLSIAFGTATFLTPLSINSGGLNGVGIIFMSFFEDQSIKMIVYNIITYVLEIGLWILGYFALGKEFAFKTLLSTILYPLFISLFTLVPGVSDVTRVITNTLLGDLTTAGTYILFALIGGVFIGFGVAVTFIGGGSSGGVDTITLLLEKNLGLKESICSFIVDGVIITAGLLIFGIGDPNTYLMPCVVGILSAAIAASMIELIYISFQTVLQMDIISSKWEEISRYIQDELERGATIIPIKGAYKMEDRIMVRAVVSRNQAEDLKHFIAKIDNRAFITIAQTKTVLGEGFKKHK